MYHLLQCEQYPFVVKMVKCVHTVLLSLSCKSLAMLDKISDGNYQTRHSCARDLDVQFLKLGSRFQANSAGGEDTAYASGSQDHWEEGREETRGMLLLEG